MESLTAQIVIAFVFGVVFVVALIVLAIAFPRPTPFQEGTFRIVLALAAAGVGAMLPGFISLELNPAVGFIVRAGGALAVFAIVFFFNPAHSAIQGPTSVDDSTASMEGDGDTEDGDKAPLTSANDPMLPQADQQPMIVLRFLDELWPEPVALKVAMKHLAAGVNTAHVEWPQRTQSLFQSVSNILKELESYQQLSSRFHKVPPEVVASSLEEGDRAYQYAKRIEQNVPIRVLALWMGMKEYWGGEPNRSSERAMRNYLALANFKIQLELSRYLKGISPAEFRAIAEGLEIWFPLDERHLYAKFFSFAEPVYSADVYYVADLNVNRYMFGPKSQIVSAYFDYSVNHRPITNGWFAEHLIPQVEFFISSRYSNSAAATCVQYREEAKINKIRDEDFEEVAYDPRGRNSKLNPA